MREKLEPHVNKRLRFKATFVREGNSRVTNNWFLFRDLKFRNGEFVCDHIWIRPSKYLRELRPKLGDRIEFDAYVSAYNRRDGSLDYNLEGVGKINRNNGRNRSGV